MSNDDAVFKRRVTMYMDRFGLEFHEVHLKHAILARDRLLFKLFLARGAVPTRSDVLAAVQVQKPFVLRRLLARCSDDPSFLGVGDHPLWDCVQQSGRRDFEMVREFLERWPSLVTLSVPGTPLLLFAAVYSSCFVVLELLLACDNISSWTTGDGSNLLHILPMVVETYPLSAAEEILSLVIYDEKMYTRNTEGKTPLDSVLENMDLSGNLASRMVSVMLQINCPFCEKHVSGALVRVRSFSPVLHKLVAHVENKKELVRAVHVGWFGVVEALLYKLEELGEEPDPEELLRSMTSPHSAAVAWIALTDREPPDTIVERFGPLFTSALKRLKLSLKAFEDAMAENGLTDLAFCVARFIGLEEILRVFN